jgi:integrase
MGLGSADAFSLAEARERARKARQMLADGIDPIEARLADRDARRKKEVERITFKDASERFLALHESGWRNPKHRAQWRSTLKTYAYATLGQRPVNAIDAALINAALAPIWETKADTASRVKQRIERVCQWVRDGMPLPKINPSKRRKHHAALPYADLPAFMVELSVRDGISARALEVTIQTAARTGEIIGAKWPEISFDKKLWTVPGARTKSGRQHRVPLNKGALDILRKLPREKDSPYVFPGGRAKKPLSNMAMLELLRGMRLNGGLTVHGFRSTFRDWAAEQTNYPREIAEAALAHVVTNKTEAAYLRGDALEKRRRLMDAWAGYCASNGRASGEVVAIRKGRGAR